MTFGRYRLSDRWQTVARAAACVVANVLLFTALPSAAASVKTEHVEVELLSEQPGYAAGGEAWLGIRMRHAPGWHTYWRNPGDAGYAIRLQWHLPPGVSAGEIAWPAPKRLLTGDPASPAINYGYDGDLLLPVPLRVSANVPADKPLAVRVQAQWLVCHDMCIPEEGELSLQLPPQANLPGKDPAVAALFANARAQLPLAATNWLARGTVDGQNVLLHFTVPEADRRYTAFDIFGVTEGRTDPAATRVYRSADGYVAQLRLAAPANGAAAIEPLSLVVAAKRGDGTNESRAVSLEAPLTAGSAALPTGLRALTEPAGKAETTLWMALVLAFAGGLILNLMPCVFPVLSLKILGFAQHAGQGAEGRSALRVHGAAYAVGVLLSFLLLAGVLLALRQGGSAIGWGFHLQSPVIVWALAVVFCLIGLNLAGLFEFGQFAPSSVLSFQARNPLVDAFFSGVIAVVAASPCSAPFMGAALGFAVAQSPLTALAVFTALGVGMALPYVLLASFPAWVERLPRPGLWMVELKQALAFPMFATVVWLIWVLAQQSGLDVAVLGLLALVLLSLGVWLVGLGRRFSTTGGVLLCVGAVAAGWPGASGIAAAPGNAPTAAATATGAVGAGVASRGWVEWTPERVEAQLAQGRPVFVDFTAAWCVSCQANKRLVLSRGDIAADFARKQVTVMRADWTNRDERITRVLNQMGRSGVPAYALYVPGRPVQLLPEILTTGVVRDAISTL